MKLAISNIAWERHDDPKVIQQLRGYGVQGIEVAPTKLWPNWEGASQKGAELYRKRMAEEGFEIPALQAILFGRPDLQLFQPESHKGFMEHIKLVADLAAGLGAEVLVFGSPKNRKRGQVSISRATESAKEFLRKAGKICDERGCCIGLEHNPVEYGCDFIINAADAREMVDLIEHPGIQLHLDSAGLHMCGGDISEVIKSIGSFVHYHISEPMLKPIIEGSVEHGSAFSALREINYSRWVSIEMKQPKSINSIKLSIAKVLKELQKADE